MQTAGIVEPFQQEPDRLPAHLRLGNAHRGKGGGGIRRENPIVKTGYAYILRNSFSQPLNRFYYSDSNEVIRPENCGWRNC